MKNRERIINLLDFKPVDRLPILEWAGWWDKTVDRWRGEGLPVSLKEDWKIREYFGLDKAIQYWIGPRKNTLPAVEEGKPYVRTLEDYENLKEHLFPASTFDEKALENLAKEQKNGDTVVWITLEGFFWFPRTMLGIEDHLCAFYDNTDLMHRLNKDLLEFNLRTLKEFCKICVPDFMTFAEDMSYNKGPMISESQFDEFLLPYYKEIVPELKSKGTKVLVDTDGLIHDLVPWFLRAGFDGFLPLERMAGVDVNYLRKNYPRLNMIGAFDKTVMHLGEAALRKEFERILPVMKSGGYIPSVDHQTPPAVSLEDYKLYVKLLKEYCCAAVK